MIHVKTPQEISIMAQGAKILVGIMASLEKQIRPGIKTIELEALAERLILKSGHQCSFKGYDGFPGCLCISINNTIVHGIPSETELKSGDLISLDIGMLCKGFHADMARTFAVGKIGPLAQKLFDATRESLSIAIKEARPGNHFGDIEWAIQNYIESKGFNVVRQLCGHGIGKELHEDPQIMNFGKKGTGQEIKPGMVFCIEPMVTAGDWNLKKSADGFGYETVDGSLSCHFEDMVAIGDKGPIVLTK